MSTDTVDRRETHRSAETAPLIAVVGEDRTDASLADFQTVERECTVTCASGDRTTATWTGVPVAELLAAADVPAGTTHLRVVSDDGYAVCVAVADALDALVALRRDGERLADCEAYPARFVGPSVAGERCVKGPVTVEAHTLAGDDDPEELEDLALDESGYG